MTTFDWSKVRALSALDNLELIPFPYAALSIVALKYTGKGTMLASVQYAPMNNGRLPRKPGPVPLGDIIGEAYLAHLRGLLDNYIGRNKQRYELRTDGKTLYVEVPVFEHVAFEIINAFDTGGRMLNPAAPDGQGKFVKRAYWGPEALHNGRKVGSFYYYAWHQGYAPPWEPGAVAPPFAIR